MMNYFLIDVTDIKDGDEFGSLMVVAYEGESLGSRELKEIIPGAYDLFDEDYTVEADGRLFHVDLDWKIRVQGVKQILAEHYDVLSRYMYSRELDNRWVACQICGKEVHLSSSWNDQTGTRYYCSEECHTERLYRPEPDA